jgi:aldose 1-epimerase
MPATIGYHPWFAAPVELDVAPTHQYRRDADGLPDGTFVAPDPRPWDDCFTGLAAPPTLTFGDGLVMTVTADVDHWVLYTPDHAVCVEPQTGPPDGPHLEPHVVEPGAPLVLSMDLSWPA